jgi:hypothetical protein
MQSWGALLAGQQTPNNWLTRFTQLAALCVKAAKGGSTIVASCQPAGLYSSTVTCKQSNVNLLRTAVRSSGTVKAVTFQII